MFAMPIRSRVAPERIGCLRVSEETRNGILQRVGFTAQQSIAKRPALLQMIGPDFSGHRKKRLTPWLYNAYTPWHNQDHASHEVLALRDALQIVTLLRICTLQRFTYPVQVFISGAT